MENNDRRPMPLREFLSKMAELVKAGKWSVYKEAVKLRRQWFEEHPGQGEF